MKRQVSSIEWMGIIGLIFWGVVLYVRKADTFDTSSLSLTSLIIWTAPNFCGAWLAIACFKQFFSPIFSKKSIIKFPFTKKVYTGICVLVFSIGFMLEILNPYLLGGTTEFDIYDMVATTIAVLLVWLVPILFHANIFESKQ